MKLKNVLIVVNDMERAKDFYKERAFFSIMLCSFILRRFDIQAPVFPWRTVVETLKYAGKAARTVKAA